LYGVRSLRVENAANILIRALNRGKKKSASATLVPTPQTIAKEPASHFPDVDIRKRTNVNSASRLLNRHEVFSLAKDSTLNRQYFLNGRTRSCNLKTVELQSKPRTLSLPPHPLCRRKVPTIHKTFESAALDFFRQVLPVFKMAKESEIHEHVPHKTQHKERSPMTNWVYDVFMWTFSILVDLFFREVHPRGSWKVPRRGPVIFVAAPHANQVSSDLQIHTRCFADTLISSLSILLFSCVHSAPNATEGLRFLSPPNR
jgi:hypothetical protein